MERAAAEHAFAVLGSAFDMTGICNTPTNRSSNPMRNEYEESVSPAVADRIASTDTADTAADRTIVDARHEQADKQDSARPAVVEEVLIEEVSIDGMCGVY
jgi:mycofactocin precursor